MANAIALITGAGTGIGKACAQLLAANSFSIILTGRRQALLDEVKARLPNPDQHLAIAADVSRETEVTTLFNQIGESYGRLDLLFNNAGTGATPQAIDELPVSEWLRVLNVNLTGSYLCARAAVAMMKQQRPQGGRIINNGSVSAHAPRPNSTPYTTTKHAITGLTKSLSLDGRPYNITCGQIDIGNALTEMTGVMTQGVTQADGSVKPEATMDVENVASALLYMAKLPLSVNVQNMTVMASSMPFIGRG